MKLSGTKTLEKDFRLQFTNEELLVRKKQTDLNDYILQLKKTFNDYNDKETKIEEGINYFIKRFKDENFSLLKDYSFTIEKIKYNNNYYYDFVLIYNK
jgi:hypothetical protein